jgi:Zn-dependent peptidase ImmA (M78 family)/transcriptional regulator with XRE-family HTH domain
MPIDQEELGRRLRQAREGCGLTQEEVADELGLSRSTVAQMELGNRAVTSLELDRLAYLYGRDIREFLADRFAEDDVLQALFRSQPEAGKDGVKRALRDCIALGHELTHLEDLLGLARVSSSMATYTFGTPRSKWDAIQNGVQVAREERRRLGLGDAPISDMVCLLENQGVRTGAVSMPNEVSGLTITHPRVGLFVAINCEHPPARQRFSWCHEYAHVLLDRSTGGRISRTVERGDLVEVRANSFAADFLMPEEGVRQFIGAMGKGESSRIHAEVFDEAGVVPVDARTEPGSQELQLYDVVPLAHFFGVSVLSALYRLRNLRLVSEEHFERLKSQDAEGKSLEVASLLGLPAPVVDQANEFTRRFLGLGLEAYRRDRISKAKLLELAAKVGVAPSSMSRLVESSGLDEEEPEPVLLPDS